LRHIPNLAPRAALLFLLCLLPAPAALADSVNTKERKTVQVAEGVYVIRHPAAVLKSPDVAAWRQKFAGDDADNRDFFDNFSLRGLVTAAYAEVWGR